LATGASDDHASAAAVIDQRSDALVAATAEGNGAAVGVAHALGNPAEPPSCTFVAALLGQLPAGQGMVTVAWCGDSRAYWLPDSGGGMQLTTDHSLGTEMIRAGSSQRDAEADPTSHTITRWLGADSVDPTPEVVSHVLDAPGWVLVCSDGLWNYASTPQALTALIDAFVAAGHTTPVALAGALVDWANAQGGHDNITAALARIDPSLA
jgi:serine/threonine protein phosphatase PrpC